MLSSGMPVLVTGGAGFIGAALVGLLRAADVPVTVVDRLPAARAVRLQPFEAEAGFAYREAALEDFARVQEIVAGHGTVFHLAANTENRADRAAADADVKHTVAGTATLLRALAHLPEATIVLASSQLVYRPGGEGEAITEATGVVEPPTTFAAGKAAAEAFLRAHCREHDHRGAICRLANVVGPGMRRGIVHDLVAGVRADPARLRVLGDGRQTRSFVHVEDCAAALAVAAGAAGAAKGCAVYNVGNEDDLSVAAVAEIVAEESPGEPPRVEFAGGSSGWKGDVPTLRVRPEALRRVGWRPRMDSGEAVRATAQTMFAAPEVAPAGDPPSPQRPAAAERWQTIGSRPIYESEWVGLSLVEVKPPGRPPYEHHVVALPAAVGVVVACPRKGVLLLHRHRFITDTVGYEVPAGGIDGSESVEAAAEREVLEETGWGVAAIEPLISCNVSDGVSDQRFHLLLAEPDRYLGPPTDGHEASSLSWIERGRIGALIGAGEVPGALSIVALLYALSTGRI